MRRITATALCFLVIFCACSKQDIGQPADELPVYTAKTSLKRTLRISGAVKSDTTYRQGDSVKTKAYYQGARLVLFLPFDTETRTNAYQDVIYFSRDTAQLPAGLTGAYSLNTTDYPNCWITGYNIEYVHPDGYEEFRYAETELGPEIRGELKIESYNPATGLVSGSYKATITDLKYNPVKQYPVLTTSPATVEIEGTFKDVKLAEN